MPMDDEIRALLGMEEAAFAELYPDEVRELEEARREADTRMLSYLVDLHAVCRMPGGAGLRVLRSLLDRACEASTISRTNSTIYAAAALHDYSREIMKDIALADPQSFLQLMLQGMRNQIAQQRKQEG